MGCEGNPSGPKQYQKILMKISEFSHYFSNNVVCILTGYELDNHNIVDLFRLGARDYYCKESSPVLRPIQLHVQRTPGTFSMGTK